MKTRQRSAGEISDTTTNCLTLSLRWTPQLAVTESKPAVRELIIFNTTDVQADTAETAGTQQYLNNRRGTATLALRNCFSNHSFFQATLMN